MHRQVSHNDPPRAYGEAAEAVARIAGAESDSAGLQGGREPRVSVALGERAPGPDAGRAGEALQGAPRESIPARGVKGDPMATTTKPFRVKYAPPGMTWAEAKAAGALRESETWMIRYRVHGRTRRESTETTNYEEARKILRERLGAADNGTLPAPKAKRVTLEDMAEALERDYETNGQRLDTLKARLAHLKDSRAFGYGKAMLARLPPPDVECYKAERLAAKASGATINRELYALAHMIARGRDLG